MGVAGGRLRLSVAQYPLRHRQALSAHDSLRGERVA